MHMILPQIFSLKSILHRAFAGVSIFAGDIIFAEQRQAQSLEYVRRLLGQMRGNRNLTQRDFWKLYENVQGAKWPKLQVARNEADWTYAYLDDSATSLNREAEAYLSARDRAELIRILESLYLTDEATLLNLADLRAIFQEEVISRVTLVVRFILTDCSNIPSTEAWVHSFRLWTGTSPPNSVKRRLMPFTTIYSGGRYAQNRRSHLTRHCRWSFDRRAVTGNSQGSSSRCSSIARGSRFERRKCIHHAYAGE